MSGDFKKQIGLRVVNRRERVAELYLQRHSQSEIAKLIGCSQQTVSIDLRALQADWKASAVRNLDEDRQRELARIDVLEREYWRAWQASKLDKQTKIAEQNEAATVTKKGAVPNKQKTKKVAKSEQRDGDPRYLAGIQWCIAQRCELLGLTSSGLTVNSGQFTIEWPTAIQRGDPPPPLVPLTIDVPAIADHAPIEDKRGSE